jgi:hypothetical protein
LPALIALLDACVIIPGALRDTLLHVASVGLYRPLWSGDILQEIERHVGRLRHPDRARQLVGDMQRVFPDASVQGYQHLIGGLSNHPKDQHVLAAAIVGQAEVIVTMNLRDFPRRALAPFGIEAWSPDDFLTYLFNLDPDLMIAAIERQAAQKTMDKSQVLDKLVGHAPTFIAAIRMDILES